jgi:hypothetical protein
MNKLTAIALSAILVLTLLAGCSKSAPAPTQNSLNDVSTPTPYIDESNIDAIIDDVKTAFHNDDYKAVYRNVSDSDLVAFVKAQSDYEYASGDGFAISLATVDEIQVIFLDIKSGASDAVDGVEYSVWTMPAQYDGVATQILEYTKADVTLGKYTGAYEEYWYNIKDWALLLSDNGTIVNGGYEGAVASYGAKSGTTTEYYTNGYDGVNMNPDDRLPFVDGEAPDISHINAPGAPTSDLSSPPSQTPTPSNTYTGDFAIEGKWKSVGDYGFGQAQPGSIVIFDGKNCNFFSPNDTYAFYKDGDVYVLDCTSMLFSQNQSFTVTIVDENNIEVAQGSHITQLKRVG